MISKIRFATNKKGKKIAFREIGNYRWVKMSLVKAELLEAMQAQDTTIYYGPNWKQPGKFSFQETHRKGTFSVVQITKE